MPKRASKRRKDILGFLLVVGVCVLVGALLWFVYLAKLSTLSEDSRTLCPTSGPESVTAVLIDATDPLNPVQRSDVQRRLEDLKDQIPKNGEFDLYTVHATAHELLRPELTVCNPGRGSEVKPLTGNQKRTEERWKRRYSDRVDQVLAELLSAPTAEISPIMESIQAVAVQAFAGTKLDRAPKRLIIVSDMMQNTVGMSQYSKTEAFPRFHETPYYIQVRPNLDSVRVEILYLRRIDTAKTQGRSHIEFWQQFFAASGATLDDVVSIQG